MWSMMSQAGRAEEAAAVLRERESTALLSDDLLAIYCLWIVSTHSFLSTKKHLVKKSFSNFPVERP